MQPQTTSIKIETPCSIRSFTPGGKGGYGYSSSPLHRLTERRINGDATACGVLISGKASVVDGIPKAKLITQYGLCGRCWPGLVPA